MLVLWAALLPFAAAVDVPPTARAACPAGEDIAYTQAPHCIGETRRVAGRVDHVSRNRAGLTFVNFCVDWKACPFTGVVFPDKAATFAFLTRLAGSEITVSGPITQYQGHAQVVLNDPSQIAVRTAPLRPQVPLVMAPPVPPAVVVADPPRPERVPEPVRPPEAGSGSDVVTPKPLAATLSPPKPEPLHAVVVSPPKAVVVPEPKPEIAVKPAVSETEELARGGVADGPKLVGRRARLKGEVARLDFKGGDLVVFFKAGAKDAAFVGVVLEPDVERLITAAEGWDGHVVELEGDVRLYDGRPGMFLRETSQIRVLQPRAAR